MMMGNSAGMCVPKGQWRWRGDDCVQEGELNPSSALQLPAFPVWTEPGVGEDGLQHLMLLKPCLYFVHCNAFLSYYWYLI